MGLLQKFDLNRACTVMSTVIQLQMEVGVREECLDLLIRSCATEVASMCTDLGNTKLTTLGEIDHEL